MASLSCIVEKTKRKELAFRKLIWVARQFARSMHKSLQVTPWKPHAVFIPFPSFWLENWDLKKGNDLAQGLTLTWGLLFHILYIPRQSLYIGIERIHMWQFIYLQWFFFFTSLFVLRQRGFCLVHSPLVKLSTIIRQTPWMGTIRNICQLLTVLKFSPERMGPKLGTWQWFRKQRLKSPKDRLSLMLF